MTNQEIQSLLEAACDVVALRVRTLRAAAGVVAKGGVKDIHTQEEVRRYLLDDLRQFTEDLPSIALEIVRLHEALPSMLTERRGELDAERGP